MSTIMHTDFQQLQSIRAELRFNAHCLQLFLDDEVPGQYQALLETAEQLFKAEQQLMENYDFPVCQSHLEQHARVLRGLHRTHATVLHGGRDQGRHVGGELLLDWLYLHEQTLDAALTIWVTYCDHGLIRPDIRSRQAAGPGSTAH